MKNRVKKLFIVITLLATLSSPYSAFADSSANSNLSQVITDCTRDSLETGSQMNESICPIFPPTVIRAESKIKNIAATQ